MDQERVRRSDLRRALDECFSESELRTLCFDLGVDYDGLPGESKADKARELVDHFWRRGGVMTLLQVFERLRPGTRWSGRFSQALREAVMATQELPHTDILMALGKTGPLGVDYRTLVALNRKLDHITRLVYVAAGAGVLALLVALVALVQ